MWYLSSWRNLRRRSNAGHGLWNKPEITPPSHSNHRPDGTTLKEPGLIEVSVADTGPGLPADVAGRLFEPFVTTKPDGMGVGLSICRTIIEAHGGHIRAESSPEGGTVFRFTLEASA